MDLNFVAADTPDFDAQTYIRMLIAIAKADKENGPPEYAFVRRQAHALGIDYEPIAKTTDQHFALNKLNVSRLTALVILKDAIMLATMDRNFSLPERQRIYGYAEKLNIPRKEIDDLEMLVKEQRQLNERWRRLATVD